MSGRSQVAHPCAGATLVEQLQNKMEIDKYNAQWIREQFNEKNSQTERPCEGGITITKKETIRAMNKIAKGKAPSFDGMMDNVFNKQDYR